MYVSMPVALCRLATSGAGSSTASVHGTHSKHIGIDADNVLLKC